ncbi:hypothetical protein [Microcoleus sp. CAWBG58]|nr:hypothetical protein [Microcoleus sp. CAWBG58]
MFKVPDDLVDRTYPRKCDRVVVVECVAASHSNSGANSHTDAPYYLQFTI